MRTKCELPSQRIRMDSSHVLTEILYRKHGQESVHFNRGRAQIEARLEQRPGQKPLERNRGPGLYSDIYSKSI